MREIVSPLDGFRSPLGVRRGPSAPAVIISASDIAEDALVGDLVGTLSVVNGSGSYTFTITADPDSKFAIDGDALELADTLDYETATSHSVTVQADNGVDDPITRTFTITVTDVSEGAGAASLYWFLPVFGRAA
jgi:hypothetical protein